MRPFLKRPCDRTLDGGGDSASDGEGDGDGGSLPAEQLDNAAGSVAVSRRTTVNPRHAVVTHLLGTSFPKRQRGRHRDNAAGAGEPLPRALSGGASEGADAARTVRALPKAFPRPSRALHRGSALYGGSVWGA